jgi:hypothetical protein
LLVTKVAWVRFPLCSTFFFHHLYIVPACSVASFLPLHRIRRDIFFSPGGAAGHARAGNCAKAVSVLSGHGHLMFEYSASQHHDAFSYGPYAVRRLQLMFRKEYRCFQLLGGTARAPYYIYLGRRLGQLLDASYLHVRLISSRHVRASI